MIDAFQSDGLPRVGKETMPRSNRSETKYVYFRAGKTAIEELHELIEKDHEAGKTVLAEILAMELGGTVLYPKAKS